MALAFSRAPKSPRVAKALRFCQAKPIHGEPSRRTLEAIETFLHQDGVGEHDVYLLSHASGPEEWLSQRPEATWLRLQAEQSQNGKAATLARATSYLSGEIFVVSDADMWAPPDYLSRVLAEFDDPKVGVVTCLYRSTPPRVGDWCHLFESLCILDFSASVLVARRTEGIRFAMGSTMAVRRQTLEEIGGFQALVPYLADDFQLGYKASQAGWKVALASTVLQTEPPTGALVKALSHQYRWLVTSRVSRPGGHLAFIVTQGLFWSLLWFALSPWHGLWALVFWKLWRLSHGAVQHVCLKGSWGSLWQVALLPWKDLLYLALWFGSLRGRRVRWGERELVIDTEGRIEI